MSYFQYDDIHIHYSQSGKGQPLVFLHGWGANEKTFQKLIDGLSPYYHCISLDFPGFGESKEPTVPWSLSDYTKMTLALLNHLHIEKPVLIGHSFGGRVSISLSQIMPLDKIILMNSAGIKPQRPLGYYLKVYGYKCFKGIAKLPLLSWVLSEPLKAYQDRYSSDDYKQASPMMKQILSKVVNEDLSHLLKQIQAPTLLIWGDLDTSTPLKDAELMASLIPDSGLVVHKGAGHFSYLEEHDKTLAIIKAFLGGTQ